MVKKIFHLLNREVSGLHEAALLLALAMFLSQLLALARDRLLAVTFGAGSALDVYYSAFRVPDFLYATIASFVSVAVLIPFLIERLEKNENQSARDFLSAVFSLFTLVMITASIIAYVFLPRLASWLTPGFTAEAQVQMVALARILLLSPFLLGLSNLFGSVTQAYRKFFIYSLSPLFYNLGIIIGVIFLTPRWGLTGLVWGVILGAGLHLAVQLPTLWQADFWPSWSLQKIKNNFRLIVKIVALSWPRTLTLSANQLVIFALVAMASYWGRGAIAVFSFANNLQSVPLALVGISYSVAAFPTLSRYFTGGHFDKFIEQIISATRHIVFWSWPALIMFVVLRAQVVRVILGAGRFDWTATRLTAACLALFALSIMAQSLTLLFIRGYYASGQTLKPLVATLFSSVLIIILAIVFNQWWTMNGAFRLFWENVLRVRGLPGTEVLILPMAYSLGFIFNALILILSFSRDWHWPVRSILVSAGNSLSSAVLGGITAYYLLNLLSRYLTLTTLVGIFTQGFLAGVGGLLVNLLALRLLGSSELSDIITAIRHKFWQGETLVPEQSEL